MGYPRSVTRPPQPDPAGTSSEVLPRHSSMHTLLLTARKLRFSNLKLFFPSHMTFLGSAVSPAPLVLRLSNLIAQSRP